MNHLKAFSTLNRTNSHRKALYKNMAQALFKNERIKTTVVKAKEIRRIIDKLITRAKNKTVHNIRIVRKIIQDKKIIIKLFDEIAPRYINRNGGYTTIIKLGRRKGDGAPLAYIELIQEQGEIASKKKKKKKIKENINNQEKALNDKEVKQENNEEKVNKLEKENDTDKQVSSENTKE